MDKITIELSVENGQGKVQILKKGKPIPHLYGFDMSFDPRKGQLSFIGKRHAVDRAGQCYVDAETNDTALESIDMLAYFDRSFCIKERVNQALQELEFAMKNIHDTSFYNTNKLFEQYGV